jgi:hypothetical protein
VHRDRSTLTTDQWTLVSNIIHVYDQQQLIERVRSILDGKHALPAKLRSKSFDTLQLISEPMRCLPALVQHSSHYRALSSSAHRLSQVNNLFFTGAVNGYLVARETHAFDNAIYMAACGALYGHDYMVKCSKDNARLEPNGNLLKIFLFVLIFSSNCSIVMYEGDGDGDGDEEDGGRWSNTVELGRVQDVYVTMLWKYMVYLYGHDQAAIRFASMVKSVIDMFNRVEDLTIQQRLGSCNGLTTITRNK